MTTVVSVIDLDLVQLSYVTFFDYLMIRLKLKGDFG